MSLIRCWARNYRSLVDVEFQPAQLTVIVGENGSGKTNLYRALGLISYGAQGQLAHVLLREGGMPSVLYAGERPRRKGESVRLVVGVTVDEVSYELSLGLPPPGSGRFPLDPEVKEEVVWVGPKRSPRSVIADRAGNSAVLTNVGGEKVSMVAAFDPAEPVLAQIGDPAQFPELFSLRWLLGRWRFYHDFPIGPDAPARWPQAGVRTPVLAADGRDLAAAVATIHEIGAGGLLDDAIADAFSGSRLTVQMGNGTYAVVLNQPGLTRPTVGAELSDGTLRFIYLAAALLSPRPPGLMVLNEPETGLHGPVLQPLAGLISEAATTSQVIITTHSEQLTELLGARGASCFSLSRSSDGATTMQSLG